MKRFVNVQQIKWEEKIFSCFDTKTNMTIHFGYINKKFICNYYEYGCIIPPDKDIIELLKQKSKELL
jgi:hypothetical protein